MSSLIIVESPTKARTIARFLGKGYQLESSFGHVRDLPKSDLGVDVSNNFEPKYVIPLKARKVISKLKALAPKSDRVILATDEDREGEAIAWHLAQALGLNPAGLSTAKAKRPKAERIVFHEITKKAVEQALENPREIDMDKVDAQQARRVLDRIVGYKLSPFLWKKITKKLSAGRVQSVAVRLIVDRENEIRNFKSQEYWTIIALLKSAAGEAETGLIEAALIQIGDKVLDKLEITAKKQVDRIVADLEKARYQVVKMEQKETKRNPPPPFTTSTLQQAAAARLRFSARKTMFLAQQLYESGHITYMRTDSVNLAAEAVMAAKKWLEKNLGSNYAGQAPRYFKTKTKSAQEAHEAIRPTDVGATPEKLKLIAEQKKLYQLIWQRFVACQMPQARISTTVVDILASNPQLTVDYLLRASGQQLVFDGYLKIWPQQFGEKLLPKLKEKEKLALEAVKADQHFTEPPPRYTEASLVKALEQYGIGRPSTYAPIISVIQDRDYVRKEQGQFQPTTMGELVNKMLVEHFPVVVDVNFTAGLENDLDEIAAGRKEWQETVRLFYEPFAANLAKKYQEVSKQKVEKPKQEMTKELCPQCSQPLVIRSSRYGRFLACSAFPKCHFTKKLGREEGNTKSTGVKCSQCGAGELVERFTRRGHRRFWGCSHYPKCNYATWESPKSGS